MAPGFRPQVQELQGGEGGGGEEFPSFTARGQLRGQLWATVGLLSQQLVEGLGGPPVLVLAAGALLLHDPVVPTAEPSSFDAAGEVMAWQLPRLPPRRASHPWRSGPSGDGAWAEGGPGLHLVPPGEPLGLRVPVCTWDSTEGFLLTLHTLVKNLCTQMCVSGAN